MKADIMKWALIPMISGIIVLSCKKEKANTPQCSTSMTGLSGSYRITALQYKPDPSAAPVDYLAFMDDCEKDDTLILKSDGIFNGTIASYDCTTPYYFSPFLPFFPNLN